MPSLPEQYFVLGIDLGSSSIGWALARLNSEGNTECLLAAGVRIFEPGVSGTDLDIRQGKDESKSVERRRARLQRRQLRRRSARQRELFELLQKNCLIPAYPTAIRNGPPHVTNAQKSAARHEILLRLDLELQAKWRPMMTAAGIAAAEHVLPYFLRAAALRQRLEPNELGRALYHLVQRRGFKSNRRETARTPEEDKEKSKVYAGIDELSKSLDETGSQTLGQYFARTNPFEKRIRQRWTARSMFEAEFEAIWATQATHYPNVLTARLKKEVGRLLFYQRPIAAQTHLVGTCELEEGRRRAPLACLDAQRFRLLQRVNDLRILHSDYSEHRLTADQRDRLLDTLEKTGDLSFKEIRKLLGLPARGAWFNLERGGEKKLTGNRTNAKMLAAFEKGWSELSLELKQGIVEEWRTAETEEWLVRRGVKRWGLDEGHARAWANANPEEGYSRLSRRALAKLLPLMEDGFPFKEAEKEIYGTRFSGGKIYSSLPPVRNAVPTLRNPAVERALTELRKVVNAIVGEYGKPHEIHIEMARDLKRSRDERREMWKSFREREGNRERLREEIGKKTGLKQPTRSDIEKALLWEECGGVCPYTGRCIDFANLFSDAPQFDTEHILPLSRCPDDSFANKTLCHLDENRNIKRNQTPWEAYGKDAERWGQILERVRRFRNPAKVRRFEVKSREELDEFSSRQLNDTRYSSKLAAEYLGALFGGRDVATASGTNRRVIHASPGGLTAILRRNWGLEAILREAEPSTNNERAGKPRSDHRHHAIDAIVIALSTPAALQSLSDAAERNAARGRESFKGVMSPWKDFVDSIRPHIEELVVSHRPERKLSGQLHDETLYGCPSEENGKSYVHVRKPVAGLSRGDLEDIVDPAVRKAVQARFEELGDLKKLEAGGASPPYLKAKNGEQIPIRKVRICKALRTRTVGEGPRLRHVAPNNNHHMEIVAELNEKGEEIRWEGVAVSLMDAIERRRKGQAIVQRDHGEGYLFKFSVMGGDTVEITEKDISEIFVVRTIASNGQLALARINDARRIKEMKASSDWWQPRSEALRVLNARKVVVDVLGRVHPAHD